MSNKEKVIHLYPDKPAEEFCIPDDAKDIELNAKDLKMLSMMRQIVKEEVSGIYERLDRLEAGQERFEEKQNIFEEKQNTFEEKQNTFEEKQNSMENQIKTGFGAMIELHKVNKKRSQNQFLEILYKIHQSKSRKKHNPEEQKQLITDVQNKIKDINYEDLDEREQNAYKKILTMLEIKK
jgi:hypothetical protein